MPTLFPRPLGGEGQGEGEMRVACFTGCRTSVSSNIAGSSPPHPPFGHLLPLMGAKELILHNL